MSADEPVPSEGQGSQGGVVEVADLGRPPEQALVPVIEAMLFAAGEPVKIRELAEALEAPSGLVERALDGLEARLEGGGLQLARVAGGVQLRTRSRYAQQVMTLLGGRPTRLSRAALEVLSILAYQQPCTRSDIDEIRGVSSGGVLKGLIERGIVRVSGRRDIPGRPLEYSTTPDFLELFGLDSLKDLPTLAEREELEQDLD